MSKKDEPNINFSFGTERYFTPEEQRRLDYLGMKAVIDTAKEDGRNMAEAKIILNSYSNGISAEKISLFLDIPIERVLQIIDNHY